MKKDDETVSMKKSEYDVKINDAWLGGQRQALWVVIALLDGKDPIPLNHTQTEMKEIKKRLKAKGVPLTTT